MSYAAEVIADAGGKWAGNGLRFATEREALDYVEDLRRRWTLVTDTRVVESAEAPTYIFVNGSAERIANGGG